MKKKFTIKEFNLKYPDDKSCLHEIFKNRYGGLKVCPKCKKETKFHRVTNRKCYACQFCGYQLHPLADTIFHKSETPLKSWFYSIFLFSVSKNGVSAKELQRQLGVTYKTAWRMAKQIRSLFKQGNDPLTGTVEVDEAFFGRNSNNIRGRSVSGSWKPIIGALQRGGKVKAKVIEDTKMDQIIPFVQETVDPSATVTTDGFHAYKRLPGLGYKHKRVCHIDSFVDKKTGVHVNNIESFWGQLKRGITGTYHSVSQKYMQTYLDEFAYRYNHREEISSFPSMVSEVAKQVL